MCGVEAVAVAIDQDGLQRSVHELMAGLGDGHLDPEPLAGSLARVVAAAEQVLRVDGVGLLLLDDHDAPRAVASSGSGAAVLDSAQQDTGVGPGADSLRDGTTVAVDDLFAVAEYGPVTTIVRDHRVRAVLSAPIWIGTELAGNLNAVMAVPHAWTRSETDAAQAYADVVASLLQVDAAATAASRAAMLAGPSDEPDRAADVSEDGTKQR